jgi:hypothetical protein
MIGFDALKDHIWWINLPAPCGSNGVRAMTPTEDALVRARQGRCRLHTAAELLVFYGLELSSTKLTGDY